MNRPSYALLRLVVLTLLPLGCAAQEDLSLAEVSEQLSPLQEVTGFGTNPGALKMYRYVPAAMPPKAPLVVAMHGCTQGAADFQPTGWSALAETRKFYVVYPEQTTGNNQLRCFNWAGEYGDPTNLKRGEGENLSIKQMVDKMKADYSIDPARVFVVGFSAGGAESALMLATWPDVFAAGAVIAGVPFDCGRSVNEATSCMSPGKDLSPADWAAKVKAAYPAFTGPYPRVSIWGGSNDFTVRPLNRSELVDQWTGVHGIDLVADETQTLGAHTRKAYKDNAGTTLVEVYELAGMGHGVPVDVMSGCGATGGFAFDVKLCAAGRVTDFFGIGTTPPLPDAGTPDAGTPDSGTPKPDAGTPDSGTPPLPDAGTADSGTTEPDSGTTVPDSGTPMKPDAGSVTPDAGTSPQLDGGPGGTTPPAGGCHCQASGGGALGLIALAGLLRRRRRSSLA